MASIVTSDASCAWKKAGIKHLPKRFDSKKQKTRSLAKFVFTWRKFRRHFCETCQYSVYTTRFKYVLTSTALFASLWWERCLTLLKYSIKKKKSIVGFSGMTFMFHQKKMNGVNNATKMCSMTNGFSTWDMAFVYLHIYLFFKIINAQPWPVFHTIFKIKLRKHSI